MYIMYTDFFKLKAKDIGFLMGVQYFTNGLFYILTSHGDYFVALMNSTCNQYYSSFLHFLLETQNQKFCLQIVTDVPYDVDVGYCAFPEKWPKMESICRQ